MAAYRGGGGVNWRDFGPDMSEGQEYGNRPAFMAMMESWIPQGLPDVHERLSSGGRVADVGCGGGWSSIAIAQAYEGVTVDGYDLDEPAVERARQNAAAHGLSDRVRFHAVDPAEMDHGEGYDLVLRVRVHPRHAAARARVARDACDGERRRRRDGDGRERRP